MSDAQGGDIRISRRWTAGLLFGTVFVFGILLLAASSLHDQALPDGITVITTTTSTHLNPTREVPKPAPAPPVRAAFVGNTRSYKFHASTCHYARCTNCTARFNTRDEAIAAGYRPCGTCEP